MVDTSKSALDTLQKSYRYFSDIHRDWTGRHTMEGQTMLSLMRDTIAELTGKSAREVQDGE